MEYNLGEIRKLISSALGDDEFLNLCQDNFLSVHNRFTTGQTRDNRISLLIDHVNRQRQIPKLLQLIKEINPNVYEEFEGYLVLNNNSGSEYAASTPVDGQQFNRSTEERLLLTKVTQEIKGRLRRSLFVKNVKPINLRKEFQSYLVDCPLDKEIKINLSDYSEARISEDHISEIFHNEAICKLLIVGNPGAGKTTTLLELAKSLSEDASEQIPNPIPVLLNLASWSQRKLISEWIILEIKTKYGGSTKSIKRWLNEQKLAAMLDGLDELKPDLQEPCINAINEFLEKEKPHYLVVCSRRDEYISRQTRLRLNEAVCLLSLNDNQIQNYLEESKNTEIWPFIQQDKKLLELVRTPLFWSISLVACREINSKSWQQMSSSEERLEYIWNSYIYKRLKDEIQDQNTGKRKSFNMNKVLKWLHWLSHQLKETRNEFILSELQPYILSSKSKRIYYFLLCLIISIIIGLTIYFKVDFNKELTGELLPQLIGLLFSIVLVVTFGGIIQPIERLINSTEIIKISIFVALIAVLISGISFQLFFGLGLLRIGLLITMLFIGGAFSLLTFLGKLQWSWLFGSILYSILYLSAITWLIGSTSNVLYAAVASGLSFGQITQITLVRISLRGSIISNSESSSHSNQGIHKSLINASIIGVVTGWVIGIISDFPHGVSFGLILWLISGGAACIQHLTLRIVLCWNGFIPWDFSEFLNYATERTLIQRVGGSYRFIHLLLQDHFVKMRFDNINSTDRFS